nr:uncharacterized protein LOC112784785 [Arachis hypogaea]
MFEFVLKIRLSNNTIRYNDIVKFGYAAMGRSKFIGEEDSSQSNSPTSQNASHVKRPTGLGGVMIGIAEQMYLILLQFRVFSFLNEPIGPLSGGLKPPLNVREVGHIELNCDGLETASNYEANRDMLILWRFSIGVLRNFDLAVVIPAVAGNRHQTQSRRQYPWRSG